MAFKLVHAHASCVFNIAGFSEIVNGYATKLATGGSIAEVEVEKGLTSHQTHYTSYRRPVFTAQMTQPTVSKH